MSRPQTEKTHNLVEKKDFRKKLRSNLTTAEATLWKLLKGSNLDGRKFRRQHSVGVYVLDFYCPEERLAIELDGASHDGPIAELHDMKRGRYLRDQGIKVIRFENDFVFKEPAILMTRIAAAFGWWKLS